MFESDIDCITRTTRYSVPQEVHSEYKIRVKRKCDFDQERYRRYKRREVSDRHGGGIETRGGLRMESKKIRDLLHPALV